MGNVPLRVHAAQARDEPQHARRRDPRRASRRSSAGRRHAARSGVEAWALFAILFCWQMPHFLAIAWMYREDYARGGFVMLPNVDVGRREHRAAGGQLFVFALLLVSLTPSLLGFAGTMVLLRRVRAGGGDDLSSPPGCNSRPAARHARQLFFASIIYLPLLLALLAAGQNRRPRATTATISPRQKRGAITLITLIRAHPLCHRAVRRSVVSGPCRSTRGR